MNYEQVKYMVEEHGKRCIELSRKLHPDGSTDLDRDEKRLLRLAMTPMVQESTEIIQSAFILGNKKLDGN